jgi:hypothetical protein
MRQIQPEFSKQSAKVPPRRYGHKFATHKFHPRVRSKIKHRFRKPAWQN